MKRTSFNGRLALTFMEILTGIVVFSIIAIPIFSLLTSTRSDTSKAVNYLRALELAQETIEWINVLKNDADFEDKVRGLSGSLVKDEGGGRYSPAAIEVAKNDRYSSGLLTSGEYPAQYNRAFFHRAVDIENIKENVPYKDSLKKVTVTIRWNEGKVPANIELRSDQAEGARMKKVKLSILVVDQKNNF